MFSLSRTGSHAPTVKWSFSSLKSGRNRHFILIAKPKIRFIEESEIHDHLIHKVHLR